MRCSALAEELGEPMIGSVDQRSRWLLIEDRSAWGTDAVEDVVGRDFADAAKAGSLRVLLVRRREGDPASDVVRRAILVDTVTREMASRTIGDVAELSLAAALDAPVSEFGEQTSDPIFLVCTNGKRDACCALRGRALVSTLAASHPERTWECTHLGGHRFAGNLVCLPDGVVYGRITPEEGARLADEFLEGRIDAALLRGRSAWPVPAQVAEQALRLRLGADGLDDLRLVEVAVDGEDARVTLAARDGSEHPFALHAERLPPRPTSCRADKIEQPLHWRVVETE